MKAHDRDCTVLDLESVIICISTGCLTSDGFMAVIVQKDSSGHVVRCRRWPMPFFSSLLATSNTAASRRCSCCKGGVDASQRP